MDFDSFKNSTTSEMPPANLTVYLSAIWWDLKGEWTKAHSLVDGLEDKTACWVHAYLHRKEGDTWNADYWYRRAGKIRPSVSLDEERYSIAIALL